MFNIDTGAGVQAPIPKSSGIDETQSVNLNDIVRAERLHRQIIENVYACETAEILEEYITGESIILDAMYLAQTILSQNIQDAIDTQRAVFSAKAHPLAKADPQSAAPTKKVF